jgi:hypothetical protein
LVSNLHNSRLDVGPPGLDGCADMNVKAKTIHNFGILKKDKVTTSMEVKFATAPSLKVGISKASGCHTWFLAAARATADAHIALASSTTVIINGAL